VSGTSGQAPAAGAGWRLEPLRRLRRAEADGAAAALAGARAAEAAAAARREEAVALAERARRAAAAACPGAGPAGEAGAPGPAAVGWATRAAWAERLDREARRHLGEVAAAGHALAGSAEAVARCRAAHVRAAAAARLLDEAWARWRLERRRRRERAAEAEADDRPWPAAG